MNSFEIYTSSYSLYHKIIFHTIRILLYSWKLLNGKRSAHKLPVFTLLSFLSRLTVFCIIFLIMGYFIPPKNWSSIIKVKQSLKWVSQYCDSQHHDKYFGQYWAFRQQYNLKKSFLSLSVFFEITFSIIKYLRNNL